METLKEFTDRLLRDQPNSLLAIWLEDIEEQLGPQEWQTICDHPLDRESVLYLARLVVYQITARLRAICTNALYRSTLTEGHKSLEAIYSLAVAEGTDVSLREINTFLTPTEAMEATGLIQLTDGAVQLTAEGREAAREFRGTPEE